MESQNWIKDCKDFKSTNRQVWKIWRKTDHATTQHKSGQNFVFSILFAVLGTLTLPRLYRIKVCTNPQLFFGQLSMFLCAKTPMYLRGSNMCCQDSGCVRN